MKKFVYMLFLAQIWITYSILGNVLYAGDALPVWQIVSGQLKSVHGEPSTIDFEGNLDGKNRMVFADDNSATVIYSGIGAQIQQGKSQLRPGEYASVKIMRYKRYQAKKWSAFGFGLADSQNQQLNIIVNENKVYVALRGKKFKPLGGGTKYSGFPITLTVGLDSTGKKVEFFLNKKIILSQPNNKDNPFRFINLYFQTAMTKDISLVEFGPVAIEAGENQRAPVVKSAVKKVQRLRTIPTADDPRKQKMVWAHSVGWGFDHISLYDKAWEEPICRKDPLNDRSLLGVNIQSDSGIREGAKKNIMSAMSYGIDGFCVDVIKPVYSQVMSRFYAAAEGLDFRIALCIDGLHASEEREYQSLKAFLQRYGNHPNNCYINGKPVIFVYKFSGKSAEQWKNIRQKLKGDGLDAYFLAQPMRENTLWDNEQTLKQTLTMFEGFYDFGVNGFFPEEIDLRLRNGKAALKKYVPEGIMVAGITTGYLGKRNGFYRPFMNTESMRNNWEAAIRNNADWVCITTWNDYIEHTHFEPSAVNRDVLLQVNRAYAEKWRQKKRVPAALNVFLNYHEEAVIGDDITIEALSLPYATEKSRLQLRVLDLNDDVVYSFAEHVLDTDGIHIKTFRITPEMINPNARFLRVQARIVDNINNEGGRDFSWVELYPIARRLGHLESIRTVRIPLCQLASTAVSLKIGEHKGKKTANILLHAWTAAGYCELIRNGWPVARFEVEHTQKAVFSKKIELPQNASPEDFYVVRYTNVSGEVSYSNPQLVRAGARGKMKQPIIVTGGDFDEYWPFWSRPRTRHAKKVQQVEVDNSAGFSVTYKFDEGAGRRLISSSGWKYPADIGGTTIFERKRNARRNGKGPHWVVIPGDNGVVRNALKFDGVRDSVVLPTRTMPYGPFVLEVLVRPEANPNDSILFADASQAAILGLTEKLEPVFYRGEKEVFKGRALAPGKWYHIAVSYDAKNIYFYINKQLIAKKEIGTEVYPINSIATIGANTIGGSVFKGWYGGFSLSGYFYGPDKFKISK